MIYRVKTKRRNHNSSVLHFDGVMYREDRKEHFVRVVHLPPENVREEVEVERE